MLHFSDDNTGAHGAISSLMRYAWIAEVQFQTVLDVYWYN